MVLSTSSESLIDCIYHRVYYRFALNLMLFWFAHFSYIYLTCKNVSICHLYIFSWKKKIIFLDDIYVYLFLLSSSLFSLPTSNTRFWFSVKNLEGSCDFCTTSSCVSNIQRSCYVITHFDALSLTISITFFHLWKWNDFSSRVRIICICE